MVSYTAGTFNIKPSMVQKKWLLIDAEGLVLGRLASKLAKILRGKHKPSYTPHVDCGDNIIIINADKVKVTGAKLQDRKFYWHTGYAGGIKEKKFGEILGGKYPERLLQKAIERMLPKESPLARKQMKNLYVYASPDHPHIGQKPIHYNEFLNNI